MRARGRQVPDGIHHAAALEASNSAPDNPSGALRAGRNVKGDGVTRAARLAGGEWLLAASLVTCAAFAIWGEALFARLAQPGWFALIFLWLFGVVLASALAVVRHADHVAEILGEPYGTLVLTLSVTAIEVMSISAVMLHGANNPTLVRDTLFSIVMILLGGVVGAALLLGGWRHSEQHYNLQGANAYLGVIIPLAVLTLTLANFTTTTPGPTLSFAQQAFLLVIACGLYLAFLAVQTGRHRGYFTSDGADETPPPALPRAASSLYWHSGLLVAYILPVVFLAEQFAHPVDYLIETLQLPAALRRHHCSAGRDARGDRRHPLGHGQPDATLDQHLARLRAVDDRDDRPGDAAGELPHQARDLFRLARGQRRPSVADSCGQRRHLRQRPYQCAAGRGARRAVRRLRDAAHSAVKPTPACRAERIPRQAEKPRRPGALRRAVVSVTVCVSGCHPVHDGVSYACNIGGITGA